MTRTTCPTLTSGPQTRGPQRPLRTLPPACRVRALPTRGPGLRGAPDAASPACAPPRSAAGSGGRTRSCAAPSPKWKTLTPEGEHSTRRPEHPALSPGPGAAGAGATGTRRGVRGSGTPAAGSARRSGAPAKSPQSAGTLSPLSGLCASAPRPRHLRGALALWGVTCGGEVTPVKPRAAAEGAGSHAARAQRDLS